MDFSNPMDVWFAVVALASVALACLIVVLLALDVRVTASLSWLEALWRPAAQLFAEPLPACWRCGETARVLGHRGSQRFFYCPCCDAPPWAEDEPQQARQVVAS